MVAALKDQFAQFDVPRIDEYFGPFAMLEDAFTRSVQQYTGPNLAIHLRVASKAKRRKAQADQKASAAAGKDDRYAYRVTSDGVAIIEVVGTVMKYQSSFGGAATTVIRRQVRLAANDDQVRAIVLVFDSPGGSVSGTKDLADDIAMAAGKKVVFGYCQDMCCSAAFWMVSQCTKVFSNATALVGAIGTYTRIDDTSKMYEEAGVKVHVIRAGEFKGTGESGTAVTDAQLADIQRRIDGINDQFVKSVAAGRGIAMARMRELADGRAHVAGAALELGLIDGIQSLDDTIAQAAKARTPRNKMAGIAVFDEQVGAFKVSQGEPIEARKLMDDKGNVLRTIYGTAADFEFIESTAGRLQTWTFDDQERMILGAEYILPDGVSLEPVEISTSERTDASVTEPKREETQMSGPAPNDTKTENQVATLAQLEASCPGADEKFLVGQLRVGATVATAQLAWMTEQNAQIKAAKKEADEAKEAAAKAAKAGPGVHKPLGGAVDGGSESSEFTGDAQVEFIRLRDEKVAKGATRQRAVQAIARENPALHNAYVLQFNDRNGRKLA